MYTVYTDSGYMISIAHDVADGNITEEEYQAIQETIRHKPVAPDGYIYRLKEDLSWELCQLPDKIDLGE